MTNSDCKNCLGLLTIECPDCRALAEAYADYRIWAIKNGLQALSFDDWRAQK